MAHINPRAAAAIAALALGGSPDTDASLTPEPTKETSTEHAAGNLPPAPPEFTRDEVAADSLFGSLLQDSSKPVETLPTEKDSGVKKEATGAPAEESAEYSRAAARGLVPPSGSVREQEIRAKAAEKIDAAFNPDGPWGARTTGATPTGSGARSGAADPSPAPGGTTGSKTDPGPAPKVEQLEILSAGEGKWADPTQNLAISSVNDAKLYESYNFLKKAGVDITYRNTGTITFTAQYAIEPEYEQQYIDAKQALGKFADFDLLRSEDGKLIAVFDTVTVSRKDNRGQALPEDVYHEKAKDALASMLQHTRGTLQRIETSPLESDTIAPARDFSTMSRADMEKVLESVQRERFAAEQEATLKLDLLSRLEGRQGNVSQMNGQVNAWAGQSERSLGHQAREDLGIIYDVTADRAKQIEQYRTELNRKYGQLENNLRNVTNSATNEYRNQLQFRANLQRDFGGRKVDDIISNTAIMAEVADDVEARVMAYHNLPISEHIAGILKRGEQVPLPEVPGQGLGKLIQSPDEVLGRDLANPFAKPDFMSDDQLRAHLTNLDRERAERELTIVQIDTSLKGMALPEAAQLKIDEVEERIEAYRDTESLASLREQHERSMDEQMLLRLMELDATYSEMQDRIDTANLYLKGAQAVHSAANTDKNTMVNAVRNSYSYKLLKEVDKGIQDGAGGFGKQIGDIAREWGKELGGAVHDILKPPKL